MIDVCFSIHDKTGNYCKYAASAIASVMENTREKTNIHILHDDTVSSENRKRFEILIKKYDQKIFFHRLDKDDFQLKSKGVQTLTIGALFRLKLPDVLPCEIQKVLYLDADILVDMDIVEIWEYDLADKYIAACHDSGLERELPWPCKNRMVRKESYFNSGVMLVNLNNIRKNFKLFDEGIEFLRRYPNCNFLDQDFLNVAFQNNVIYMNPDFNQLTFNLRGKKEKLKRGIYHFAGDFINMEQPEEMDRLFFQYLGKTPWATYENLIRIFAPQLQRKGRQIEIYQKFVCKMIRNPNVKKIIFGASSVLRKDLFRFIPLNAKNDYYIDNSSSLQGKTIDGVKVYPVKGLLKETKGEFIVLIASQKYYADMRYQLEQYDLEENVDFFDVRMLLSQNQGGYVDYY